jgi:pyruvate-formate lyase-activating enzyme
MAVFLAGLRTVRSVSLLPFHRAGSNKYPRLRRDDPMNGAVADASEGRPEACRRLLEEYGLEARIGG